MSMQNKCLLFFRVSTQNWAFPFESHY